MNPEGAYKAAELFKSLQSEWESDEEK
jgi:hypothetical protein